MRPGIPITDGTAKEARLLTITRIADARIAGRSTGRVILSKVRRLDAPHTLEDSSSETSKALMAGAMIR